MKIKSFYIGLFVFLYLVSPLEGQGDGFLIKDGKRLFPIGWYSAPKDTAGLKELAAAGINLVRCNNKEALDRVLTAGIQGWITVPLQNGVTEENKKLIQSVAGHPALAIWEGPDEVVWNFTEAARLKFQGSWSAQTPEFVKYANEQSAKIMPNIKQTISYIRSIDPNNLQVWINEAVMSEASFVRQYIDNIDIAGCDYYPIRATRRIEKLGFFTDRWNEIGMGKPVWMILQAFSWPDLGGQWKDMPQALPSFSESRFMAYDVIAHGARGVLYYGANRLTSEECRQSLYALTSELNGLQPFLTSPEQEQVGVYVIKEYEPLNQQVALVARQYGRDWMIALVNETNLTLRNVTVKGLKYLNGLKLSELYGNGEITVMDEEFMTRMKPYEVKVFATGRKWETSRQHGRNYSGFPVPESKPVEGAK